MKFRKVRSLFSAGYVGNLCYVGAKIGAYTARRICTRIAVVQNYCWHLIERGSSRIVDNVICIFQV